MPEREPQISEKVNIHERGGLTPAHWQEVVKRLGEPKDETSEKIVAYAQKVISGEFPDTGFHYKEYLGRRHLSVLERKVIVRTRGLNVLVTRMLNSSKLALLRDIENFSKASFFKYETFNDIVGVRQEPFSIHAVNDIHHLKWSEKDKTWHLIVEEAEYVYDSDRKRIQEGWIIFPDPPMRYEYRDIGSAVNTSNPDKDRPAIESALLKCYFLEKDELDDPIHTSPSQLVEILKTKVPDEVLKERIKNYRERMRMPLTNISGWEKEI